MKKEEPIRIAVIFPGDIESQRGLFNAVRQRVNYLHKTSSFIIDVYLLTSYDPWYVRLLRHTEKKQRVEHVDVDGIRYHLLWRRFSLVDYILDIKLHMPPLFESIVNANNARSIKGYKLISAHSFQAACVGGIVARRDNIPLYITWHGSDIHSSPFVNNSVFQKTKGLLERATGNFFVSSNLMTIAKRIADINNPAVLYNGVDDSFVKYDDIKLSKLKRAFGIEEGDKVIAFVGNLMAVKNTEALAPIFEAVKNKIKLQKLHFWIIGDGKDEEPLRRDFESRNLSVKFWGGQPVEKMPDFMNCINVLLLPSINEGLGMVLLEALSCGANAVGSAVGGIPEVLGNDNVFTIDNDFIDNISSRIVYMLENQVEQKLDVKFSWGETAIIETKEYMTSLKAYR